MINSLIKRKILLIAPHTDDIELGCGGSVAKWIEDGHEIKYVAFSDCNESLPEGFEKGTLKKEMEKATGILGIPMSNVQLFDMPVRKFLEHRQEILDILIVLRSEFKPDIVLIPSQNDIHQDHQVITNEALRAFKHCTIFGYELPWNQLKTNNNGFVSLKATHVDKKVSSISAYSSQQGKSYAKEEYIRALALTRGVQINHEFAEAFEIIRTII
jgi:LmbE family N-acetylglucosaminyl deacetylase